MTYYIAPRFLNKLAVHITKNYLDLPQVKVPLILGIHGRKGEGKTFQCELVFERMGVEVVHISGGELESPDAGDPARLIRLRYREAAELVRVRGRMAVLMINDLDAGAGRFDRMTQYTVNTQLVNNTLMNIADNPTNVQLPGSYDEKALPRIPIIATGNDFATLYAPLIRDGRMQKFYWQPSEEDRVGIVGGMFAGDGLSAEDIEQLVKQFKDQAVDFFGAVRSQLYDEQITRFIEQVGIEKVATNVVNTPQKPTFNRPHFTLDHLVAAGNTLVEEQDRVRTMGLVNEYNQALTPRNSSWEHMRPRRDPELLTPPANNGLTPYGMGSEQTAAKESSPWQRLREARIARSIQPSSNANGSEQPSRSSSLSSLSSTVQQQLQSVLSSGDRIAIEHSDQRRFRMNSWQPYAAVDTANQVEAKERLQHCLSEFSNYYIRLIGINTRTKQRTAELIVHRPD
ncbi:ribulose bisphosphate carboxylase, small subunit, putative [Synechococcus sp. PCC 7335]|uniref:AAA family ATPase n=1 Tax=Synechococcus sp. (strain ATCC 29403 / PCC 7335) TaxID=91464 RepID=UPI00017EB4C5|nr:ribulose bisphosphate carboxylase small subunit [Synechococcus sp. PCC 7335]EDX85223.1 ribulose bisphosphate carboxylase, small subunit, putative [Synechococcus sp. PCC 7335]